MKIMIVSDTHRNHDNLKLALEKEKPIDQMIHCGDSEGAEYIIEEIARCPLEIVLGNNDFFSDLEREKEFQKVLFSDEIHIAAPKRNEGRGFTPRPVRSPASAGFP